MIKKRTIVALGSNYEPQKNLEEARLALEKVMEVEFVTAPIWTYPIEGVGPKYLNCLATGFTTHSQITFTKALKHIERRQGSSKGEKSRNHIHLDLDLLLYDGVKFHEDDWNRDYIQDLLRKLP